MRIFADFLRFLEPFAQNGRSWQDESRAELIAVRGLELLQRLPI
jgi:hypothetical protein